MRMSISNKWLIIIVLALQLLLTVHGQTADEPSDSAVPKPTTTAAPKPTTTAAPAPTVAPPPPVTTTISTLKPPVPSSSSVVKPPVVSSVITPPVPTSVAPVPDVETTTSTSSTSSTISSTTSSSTPSASPTKKPDESGGKSNTALIVGCAVGGVVGLALIGGILACINRRGGCAKKRSKKSDFEDYGLGDFPHHRTSAVAAPVMTSSKPMSPTLPRLNEQGNYYNEDPNYGRYGYQDNQGYDNNMYQDNNMDYGMQPQQGYYYPTQQQQPHHQQQQQQEYYDDSGYYYDSNASGTAYSSVAPMQQHQPQLQQAYMMNNSTPQHSMVSQDIYKPDEVSAPVRSNTNITHPNR